MPGPYVRFALTLLASLLAMWLISLAQIRSLDHFYLNLSNLYIGLTGVGVMGLIMFAMMRRMFADRQWNFVTVVVLALVAGGGFLLARTEAFVGDQAFLESMIPHHSRALVVCEEADLTDPEVVDLCDQIVRSQLEEIDQMQEILDRS